MKKKIWFLLITMAFVLSGCMKYEDGPLMSLYSKGMRVGGTWYFENVQYDGKDSTSHYPYQQMNFFYVKKTEGGGFTWNRNLLAQEFTEEIYFTGTWRFLASRDSFEMVIYRNQLRDSTIYQWKINRLAYTEFWIERTVKDTLKIEWKLIKYAY